MYYRMVVSRAKSDTWRVLREKTAEEVVVIVAGAVLGAIKSLSDAPTRSLAAAWTLLVDTTAGAVVFAIAAVALVVLFQLLRSPARLAQDQEDTLEALAAEHDRQLNQRDARISDLVQEAGQWRSDFFLAFTRDHLKRRYGEASRRLPVEKMKELRQLFEDREEEIARGDYSRAAEVPDILRYYEPMVERWLRGKGGYEPAMNRIREIEARVEKYFAERSRPPGNPSSTESGL